MAQVQDIMDLYEREGLSQRQIAKMLGIARNTVARVLENPGHYLGVGMKTRRPSPKRALIPAVTERIDCILKDDLRQPRKQRHTARRIWERLTEEGYVCGESTVRRYVGEKKRSLREVFIPLEFGPGEDAQVDWGYCEVDLDGVRTKAAYFIGVLSWSRAAFMRVYHAATQEAFLDGLARFFEFMGGVPARVWFDLLASAVKSNVFRGLVEQEKFTAFRAYYGFEAHFCNAAKPNEKGRVESKVGSLRRSLLVPVPSAESLRQINAVIETRLKTLLERPVPDGDESVGRRLSIERKLFKPLPGEQYPCYRTIWTTANKTSLVNVAKNWYSVPTQLRGKRLTVHLHPERVEVYDEDRLVCCHHRIFGEKKTVCDLGHYLDGLARKPGALRNAKPYRQAELPVSLRQLHEHLLRRDPNNGDRQMVEVLLLARFHGLDEVGMVAEQAISSGVPTLEFVMQALEGSRRPTLPAADLEQYQVWKRSANEFDALVAGGGRAI